MKFITGGMLITYWYYLIGGFDDMPKVKVLIFVMIAGYTFAELVESIKRGKQK